MSRYVDSFEIEDTARTILSELEKVDDLIYSFQIDMDSNDHMKESLDWTCDDLKKSLERTIHYANELAYSAEEAAKNED